MVASIFWVYHYHSSFQDIEAYQHQIEELQATNDKLDRSKKKLEGELDDVNLDLVAQRSKVMELEKKQRNFDKVLAEEKVKNNVAYYSFRCQYTWKRFSFASSVLGFLDRFRANRERARCRGTRSSRQGNARPLVDPGAGRADGEVRGPGANEETTASRLGRADEQPGHRRQERARVGKGETRARVAVGGAEIAERGAGG